MLKLEDNRVLVRAGARELTIEEIDYVNGGAGPLQTTFARRLLSPPLTLAPAMAMVAAIPIWLPIRFNR